MCTKQGPFFFTFFAYTVFAYLFWIARDAPLAAAVLAGFVAFSFFFKAFKPSVHFSLLVAVLHIALFSVRNFYYTQWPTDLLLASMAGFLFYRFILKEYLRPLGWSFRLSRKALLSILVINVPALFVLIWYYKTHLEVASKFPFPEIPLWAVPLVVIAVALINGLREELMYRGILQTASESYFPAWFQIAFQAVFFGSLHFIAGFPQGWLGVGLTALWGAAIAIQYKIFRSMSLSWMTHSMADAIMFSIILIYKG